MEKHFIVFYSPGTFVAEMDEQEIDSWDVDEACNRARNVKQRYGATPYGFKFVTWSRSNKDLDSKVSNKSGMYYLGGQIQTLEELEIKGDPKDRTLISNMKINGWNKVITNTNSYSWTQPFNEEEDMLLDWEIEKGA